MNVLSMSSDSAIASASIIMSWYKSSAKYCVYTHHMP